MSTPKKGHYRVDAVRRSGEHGTDAETVKTMASGLTYKEAKQMQKALYEKYGYGGPLFFRPVRQTERRPTVEQTAKNGTD